MTSVKSRRPTSGVVCSTRSRSSTPALAAVHRGRAASSWCSRAREANVRWANNTVTTNGLAQDAVLVRGRRSAAARPEPLPRRRRRPTRRGRSPRWSRAAQRGCRGGGPGRPGRRTSSRWSTPAAPAGSADFDEPAGAHTFDVFSELLGSLAAAFDGARAGDRILYGFARHEMTTIHLGSSTGLRLRWVQPTGLLEVNAKSADLRRSAWAGLSTADFARRRRRRGRRRLWPSGWSGPAARSTCRPGRYDTVLPPTAVADFMIYLAWSAGARPAHEGRSAFSAPGGGTRLGERLTDRGLTLFSDPAAAGLESTPFVVTASLR